MATLIQEIIVKLKCLEYLAMRLKSTFKKRKFLKSEAEEIVPTIRECLDMNTIFFKFDIYHFFRQNMDSFHQIHIV